MHAGVTILMRDVGLRRRTTAGELPAREFGDQVDDNVVVACRQRVPAREVLGGDGSAAQPANTPRARQTTPVTTASTPAFRNPFDTPPQGS